VVGRSSFPLVENAVTVNGLVNQTAQEDQMGVPKMMKLANMPVRLRVRISGPEWMGKSGRWWEG
jgi:hypothetical protein